MAARSVLAAAAEPAATTADDPVDLEAARAYLAAAALRPTPVGRVGLELERHVIDLAHPTAVVGWARLQRALGGVALSGGSRLTLEPGGQVELSTPPADGVAAAVQGLQRDDRVLRAALTDVGLGLLGLGADPLRPPVMVHAADRYASMAGYFAAAGHQRDGTAMMCSTASLQLNLDAGVASAWADRVAHVHLIGPALVALASCSPLLGGRETGRWGNRQSIWQRLDPGRCAPHLGRGEPAASWAAFALAAPVMMVRLPGSGRLAPVRERVPLVDWCTDRRRLGGRRPTAADLDLHLSTLWPPLRLRGWLEVRLLDAVPSQWWPGLAAIVATVIDHPGSAARAAAAAEPVADRWFDAARLGIRDPALLAAARGVVSAALAAAPASLRSTVEAWATLLERGRSPAHLVLDRARRDGPAACLTALELS
jgi:ergothioneine biosynthesis glutamate--cysteine ligase EgtA